MHAYSFEAKRVHIRVGMFVRKAFVMAARKRRRKASVLGDMTLARYDILHAVYRRFAWLKKRRRPRTKMVIPFDSLVRKLGLSISTVSVAVARMEELGFVRRVRSDRDRRCTIVEITTLGEKAFHAAQRVVRVLHANLGIAFLGRAAVAKLPLRGDARSPTAFVRGELEELARDERRFARFFGSLADAFYMPRFIERML